MGDLDIAFKTLGDPEMAELAGLALPEVLKLDAAPLVERDTEVTATARRVDRLYRLGIRGQPAILHVEVLDHPRGNESLAIIHERAVLVHRKHRLPVVTLIIGAPCRAPGSAGDSSSTRLRPRVVTAPPTPTR